MMYRIEKVGLVTDGEWAPTNYKPTSDGDAACALAHCLAEVDSVSATRVLNDDGDIVVTYSVNKARRSA